MHQPVSYFYHKHIFLCTNLKAVGKTCCATTGGEPFFDYFKQKLVHLGLFGPGKVRLSKSGCLGRCSQGPCMVIYPDGIWYRYNQTTDLDVIIDTHLINHQLATHLMIDQS